MDEVSLDATAGPSRLSADWWLSSRRHHSSARRRPGRRRRRVQHPRSSSLPRHRLQDFLVAAQVAGALMLVVGAVLFAQSFLRAQSEDPGYPAEHLIIGPSICRESDIRAGRR